MLRSGFSWNGGWLAVAVAVLLTAAPAAAQVSTGAIEVVAYDQEGAMLPGVTVQAVNPDTGLQRVAVSDGQGVAIFRGIAPGTYTVSAALDGFAEGRQENIQVRLGQTQKLVFNMKVQVSETITVTGEAPVVDVLKMDSSTNITPEMITDLPVPSREFERLAYIAPGVARERGGFRFIQNSPVIGASGNASGNSINIDGAELTDQALGLSRTRVSQDAIREFRVVTARFDPEIGGSPGGALNVVTKSGTNEVHGSVFGFYRGADLRETGELEQDNDEFERYQLGFTLGGPFKRDKTHYFLSFEYVDETTITPFRPQGAYVDLAEDVPTGFEQTLGMFSLDHQFSASSNGFIKGLYEDYEMPNFRVGGVSDVSNGQLLERENWNFTIGHIAVFDDGNRLNELRAQYGSRYYFEPTNSDDVEEWFSSGTTLRIGANVVGDLLGDGTFFEVKDTFTWHVGGASSSQDIKLGGGWYHIKDRSDIPVYQEGLILYLTDDRTLPLAYIYGTGSADITKQTDILSFWFNDDWRPLPNLTLSLGLRYDVDLEGNNPDFSQSDLVGPRSVDENNFQPRVAFTWDMGNDGKSVLRGGAGIFTGRYLLVPAFSELQQNGTTGRVVGTNFNGLIFGLPPEFWLDLDDPENTGLPQPIAATILEDSLKAPESWQASLGFTQALGDTGLYLDLEGLYAEGKNEIFTRDINWNGNDDPTRPNGDYGQINQYGNDGHSEYWAGILSLNGTFGAGHVLTSSLTWSEKKNLSDDFSPVFPFGYPNDPADPEGEWGFSRGHEDLRFVLSGVFRLPANFSLGATYIYGSGQPWNRLVGVDVNGDGKNSDRLPGVARNDEEGPTFSQFNLRVTWTIAGLDIIAEAFNLFNETNYDVNSINNFEFLSYPTFATPDAPIVENPAFGTYSATLQPLEIQLGLRYRF
jgi:hypothetical protein